MGTLTAIGTRIADPKLLRALRQIEQRLEDHSPIAQFEYVTVTFNATANADTTIVHTLRPPTPDDVDYEVVRWNFGSAPATTPVLYVDSSGSKRAWGDGYIVLRCNIASASVTLRLTVRN